MRLLSINGIGTKTGGRNRFFFRYFLLFSTLVFCIFQVNIQKIYGFSIYPDEFGYWASAAQMLGWDWTDTVALGSYYSYGYSLLLAPILWIFRDSVAAYETVGSRGRVIDTGRITVVDDCYNANPTSVRSAIESLSHLPGRRVAILGDMRELGQASAALHRQIGAFAAERCALVIACGLEAKPLAEGAGKDAPWFATVEELVAALPDLIHDGDAVLVKASRAMGFERVTEALMGLEK